MKKILGAVGLGAVLGAGLMFVGGSMAANQTANKEPRFPQLVREGLRPDQVPFADQILKVSSLGLGGPYNLLLRSPVMGQRFFDLADYIRFKNSVPLHLNEFAILIISRQWRSQIEWFAHAPIALKAGLPQHILDDLKAKRRPANMKPEEAAVYDFVTELYTTHKVSDETFARAKQALGEQGVIDITATAGMYVTVAMLLAMSEQPLPPGKEPPFKPGEP